MARTLDLIALSILLTVIGFVWGALVFQNAWLALVVAASLSLAIVFAVKFYTKSNGKENPSWLATEFAIKGNEYVVDLLKTTLKNAKIESTPTCICLENCLILSCFKFGSVSSQDVAKVANLIESKRIKRIFVLANGVDRSAYQIANYLGVRLKLVKTRALYKYLKQHDALPVINRPKRKKFSFEMIFEIAFSRSNFKAYTLSGLVLLFTSFITPLKLYYIISGSICLLLAIFSLVFGNGNLTSANAFRELESAVSNDCASNDDTSSNDPSNDTG